MADCPVDGFLNHGIFTDGLDCRKNLSHGNFNVWKENFNERADQVGEVLNFPTKNRDRSDFACPTESFRRRFSLPDQQAGISI